jgi:hypothetical protein
MHDCCQGNPNSVIEIQCAYVEPGVHACIICSLVVMLSRIVTVDPTRSPKGIHRSWSHSQQILNNPFRQVYIGYLIFLSSQQILNNPFRQVCFWILNIPITEDYLVDATEWLYMQYLIFLSESPKFFRCHCCLGAYS